MLVRKIDRSHKTVTQRTSVVDNLTELNSLRKLDTDEPRELSNP